ncbi:hypothetical protein ACTMR8_15120, partial [Enterococcus faecium]|uniref:hypothetical protein n=1 Tax=Enterococcus faecium TaxID=1352 RepID=UPI003F88BDCC
ISVCQVAHLFILVIIDHTFSLLALIVIVLLHFTGALLLILFIFKLFCADELADITKLIAIKKIDFVSIAFFCLINNAKAKPSLDKNQEVYKLAFFLNLLKVSGAIPSIEAKYCSGT